jgi:hypothetical protein
LSSNVAGETSKWKNSPLQKARDQSGVVEGGSIAVSLSQ